MSKDTKSEVSSEEEIDFDLPDVSEDAPKAKPRIHSVGGSVCESCEG